MNIETRIPAGAELGHERFERTKSVDHVKAAFGRPLGSFFRHEAAGVRADAQRDVEHGLGRGHFEIERLRDRGLEPPHIVVVNVAPILAQVRGDPVSARLDRNQRRPNRIGRGPAARIAHGRDMVDIDAKA